MEQNTQLRTTDRDVQNPQSSLVKFKNLLSQDTIKNKFNEALGKKAPLFMSNLVTIMSGSVELQKCEHMSIISSALMAASMDLPLTPGLGFAGIVPYWDTPSGTMKAQFQVMKKGYVQLAQRTGLFKIINVSEVYEGEMKSYNKFTGEYVFDETGRKSDTVIGYVSYFRLINGFEKYFYMPIEKLDKHARKYSKSFQKGKGKWADKEEGGYEQMCEKTVLKLNLATYAPLSVDINMMNAIVYDQAEIRDMEAKDFEYVDNEDSQKIEHKEVLEVGAGKTVVINEAHREKTNRMTERASDKIPDNKFGAVKENIQEATIVPETQKEPEKTQESSGATRGTFGMMNGEVVVNKDNSAEIKAQNENQGTENQDNHTGKYSLKDLEAMDTKILLGMVNADTDMIEASEMIGGKNTNRKLREIIFASQEGKLAEHVAKNMPKGQQGDAPGNTEGQSTVFSIPDQQAAAQGDIPVNKGFDSEKTDNKDFLSGAAPDKKNAVAGNKYNLQIPEFNKGNQRDFASMKQLFNLMAGVSPSLNNPRYLELAAKAEIINTYPDRETFCKLASVDEVNKLLNIN